jgi:hypothetical protein
MACNNPVYIDLTANTNECSHGRHSAPQTHAACRTAETGRPGQRHAQGSSYVDLIVEAKLDPKDPLYDPDRERVLLEEMRGML